MEVINTKKIATVELAEVLISSDEIGVYQIALDLVLLQMSEKGNRKQIRRNTR